MSQTRHTVVTHGAQALTILTIDAGQMPSSTKE
jgi:hypothetical protein